MDTKETELNKNPDISTGKKSDEMDQNDFEDIIKHVEELADEGGFNEETLEEVNKYIAENVKSDNNEVKAKISKNFNDLGIKYQFSDSKEAVKYFKMAADLGSTNAMVNYSSMLQAGLGVNEDNKEAAKYLKMAADLGNTDATVRYANTLINGAGVEPNREEALKYFEIAANNGNIDGIISYANLLKSENNLREAEKYFKMAADKGNTGAMVQYAQFLETGDGFEKNLDEAKIYYKMAADKGNMGAMSHYANLLRTENGFRENIDKVAEAKKYYEMAIDKGNSTIISSYIDLLKTAGEFEKNIGKVEEYYKMAIDKGDISAILNYADLLRTGDGFEQNLEEAKKYYEIAIDKGSTAAMLNYADLLRTGDGFEQNLDKAEKYYKIAIDKGDISAILNYADLLRTGDGFEQNLDKAEKYYRIAIDKGDIFAMHHYADLLRTGDGFEQNLEEAEKYYKMAADKGNINSMLKYAHLLETSNRVDEAKEHYKIAIEKGDNRDIYNFAFNLEKGADGMEKDYKKALEFYQAAMDKGCNYCYNNMGNIYLNGGYGVEKDYNKAIEYFTKAAELGNKDAIYNLGLCYKNGYGVEENYEKALEYYKKAAEQNQPDAINALGNWYKLGFGGIEEDCEKANEYYEKAADLGCADAMVNLGNAYFCGYGFEINETKALEYYEKAAELGNIEAINQIFYSYEENELCDKIGLSKLEKYCQIAINDGNDTYYNFFAEICLKNGETEKALEYYEKAAEKGDADALTLLGSAYYKGEYGFEKNEGKALEYFNKVVDNDKSGYNISEIADNFLNGENGFEKDFEKAKYFYEKAAKKGNDKAMYELGDIYFYGKYDVEADRNLAIKYLKGAAEKGNSRSAFRIATIYDNQENLDEAIKYYKIAVERGSTYAAINLAYLYENGIGVEKNEAEAARLYGTVGDPKFVFDLAQGYEEGTLEKQDFKRAKRFYEIAKERGYEVDEKKFSELDEIILEENKVQESINDRNYEYKKIKEGIYEDIKDEVKKATNIDYKKVDTFKQLTDKYRGDLEITKEMTKRLKSTKEFVKSPVATRNMAKCINNKEKNPTTTDIIPMLDYIPNEKDVTKDSVFRDMTLPAIEAYGRKYEGFGAKMLNSDDNKIKLCFNDDGFIVEQLERMGLKEEAEIFKNGAIVIDGQGKLSQKDINEFHLKFKVSPIEAYLDICEKGAKINYSDDKKSFDGQEVTKEFKNKIVNGLAAATESRGILADISRCSENIGKSDNEEYKQIAEFIKEYSLKILEKTEVDEEITNGCQIKSSFMVAKQAVELLKAMDNAANGKTNSIEQAQTLRDLATIKFNANSNDEKYKKEYFINCINKTLHNNLGAVDRHLSAELVKKKSKASGRSI